MNNIEFSSWLQSSSISWNLTTPLWVPSPILITLPDVYLEFLELVGPIQFNGNMVFLNEEESSWWYNYSLQYWDEGEGHDCPPIPFATLSDNINLAFRDSMIVEYGVPVGENRVARDFGEFLEKLVKSEGSMFWLAGGSESEP